jgi:hypothetical protein
VVIYETRHRRYEVFAVSGPLGRDRDDNPLQCARAATNQPTMDRAVNRLTQKGEGAHPSKGAP